MNTVNRTELLQRLDAVQPGLSQREITDQSSCFVFKDGYVWTYNEDIGCKIKSGLPVSLTGAVIAKPLMEALNNMTSVMIHIDVTNERFVAKDKKCGTSRIIFENTVKLAIDDIQKPIKNNWRPLPPGFGEAIGMVEECASRDETETVLTSIHIHPKWVEACDNTQMSRYRIKTGVQKPIMVKRDSIKHIISMDMTETNETEKWIHFRNGAGLIISCVRYVDKYPHDQITALFENFKGRKGKLPKGIAVSAKLAHNFSREDADDDQVFVKLEPGRMTIKGVGNSGDHTAPLKCDYTGPVMEFKIGPKLLTELSKQHSEAKFSKEHLVVESKRWQYLTALSAPVKAKEVKEEVAGDEDDG